MNSLKNLISERVQYIFYFGDTNQVGCMVDFRLHERSYLYRL